MSYNANFLVLTPALAAKIAAIVVHSMEMFSVDGHQFDRIALETVLRDPEVKDWIRRCGALAPAMRRVAP